MSDFNERLVAADPVATSPYAHADLSAMTARITAVAPARPRQVLRTFQLRMASAVAMATVVTVGAIAALESAGPSLSVLAVGTTNQTVFTATNAAPVKATSTSARLHFVAGPAISTSGGFASALELKVPKKALTEVARVAATFSVTGLPTRQLGTVGTWDVRGSSGAVVSYRGGDVPPHWTFSNGSSAPVLGPVAVGHQGGVVTTPAQPTYETEAAHYLSLLGVTTDLGRPTVTWTSDPNLPVTAQPPLDREVIIYPVRVAGVPTDQSYVFMFDTTAKLLWASGPDFTVSNSTRYPLTSAANAVHRLNSDVSSPTAQALGPSAPANITLMSEALSLRTFRLTNGVDWMLPTYEFSQIKGGPSTRWWIVAIEPRFLSTSSARLSGVLSNTSIHP